MPAGPVTQLVKRINATYLGWPLSVSEYRTAKALAEATDWSKADDLGQGDPPVTIVGLNILIEWGPTTGSTPPAPEGPQIEGLRDLATGLDVLLSPLRCPGGRRGPRCRRRGHRPSDAEATPAP